MTKSITQRYRSIIRLLTAIALILVVMPAVGCTFNRELAFEPLAGVSQVETPYKVEIQEFVFDVKPGAVNNVFVDAGGIYQRRLSEQIYARKMTPVLGKGGNYALRGYFTETETVNINGWVVPYVGGYALGLATVLVGGYAASPAAIVAGSGLMFASMTFPHQTYRHEVISEISLVELSGNRELLRKKYTNSSKKWCNVYHSRVSSRAKINRIVVEAADPILAEIANDTATAIASAVAEKSNVPAVPVPPTKSEAEKAPEIRPVDEAPEQKPPAKEPPVVEPPAVEPPEVPLPGPPAD